MNKLLFLLIIFLKSFFCFSQDPKKIEIEMKDTLENREDVFVKVSTFSKGRNLFELPQKITFGTLISIESIFQIKIQKKEGNRFIEYFSNFPPPESQSFREDSIKFLKYNFFQIVNDLTCVGTLDSGYYRLKVFYNKRKPSGEITDPNFIISSRWHYFFVSQDIDLFKYR